MIRRLPFLDITSAIAPEEEEELVAGGQTYKNSFGISSPTLCVLNNLKEKKKKTTTKKWPVQPTGEEGSQLFKVVSIEGLGCCFCLTFVAAAAAAAALTT